MFSPSSCGRSLARTVPSHDVELHAVLGVFGLSINVAAAHAGVETDAGLGPEDGDRKHPVAPKLGVGGSVSAGPCSVAAIGGPTGYLDVVG